MAEKTELLVYGAYGYTGEIICENLTKRGEKFVVAGRNAAKTKQIAERFSVPYKVFDLEPAAAEAALEPVAVVLHCAGPYSVTSKPMVDACIKTKTSYLDITGEYTVIEAIAARDEEIRKAGIMAMPSTGMDVVPSDCLLSHVASKLPSATNLKLFIRSNGGLSAGTSKTVVEMIGGGSKVRKDGEIVTVSFGDLVSDVTFPDGSACTMVNFPWGDVASGYHSTKVPNIEVYMGVMPPRTAKIVSYLSPILNLSYVRWGLQSLAGRYVKGLNEEQREGTSAEFVAIANDNESNSVRSYLKTINGYSLTALTSVEIALRVLKGNFKPGFQTPSSAYGADFILEFPGSERKEY